MSSAVDPATAIDAAGQINLACLEVDGQTFAIDVTHVREIVREQPITPLPMAPALIEGVIELRGGMIPVLDLARLLCGRPSKNTAASRVVVVDFDGLVLGLCVEGATDVLSLLASELEDVPTLASHAGYEAVRAVIRRPDAAPVMLLSIEHILECVYRSALPTQGDTA